MRIKDVEGRGERGETWEDGRRGDGKKKKGKRTKRERKGRKKKSELALVAGRSERLAPGLIKLERVPPYPYLTTIDSVACT